MFTATWPPEVQELAESLCCSKPIQVNIGEPKVTANHNITQKFIMLKDSDDKYVKLIDILNTQNEQKCIIFSNTKV